MSRIWMPGGAGGADLDVITAGAGDILSGKVIVGPDGEPLTGVLTLTGTAADSQVLAGKTYYNTDAKTKRTGTMATAERAIRFQRGITTGAEGSRPALLPPRRTLPQRQETWKRVRPPGLKGRR